MKILKVFAIFSLFLQHTVLADPKWYKASDGTKILIEKADEYNWYQAWHECLRKNAQLVVIDSEQKNELIMQILEDKFDKTYNLWIGGHDAYSYRQDKLRPFFWSATGRKFSFKYWSNNQPDNFQNREHCVHIAQNSSRYHWNDNCCYAAQMGYVCEERTLANAKNNKIDVESHDLMESNSKEDDQTLEADVKQQSTEIKSSVLVPLLPLVGKSKAAEDLLTGDESTKELNTTSENSRKWKDIIKSSLRKAEFDIVASLFRLNRAVYKEAEDEA